MKTNNMNNDNKMVIEDNSHLTYIEDWKSYMDLNEDLSPLSVDKYSGNVTRLLKDYDLYDLNYMELTKIIQSLRKTDMSLKTINLYIISLKKYYKFLYDMELRSVDYANKLKTFTIENDDNIDIEKKSLTESEMKQLVEIVNQKGKLRDITFITLLLTTGLRLSEATNIKINNIDWERKMITVVRKGNEIKEIFVTDIILKNIKKYIDNERPNVDNEYLFISNHKKQISVRTFQRTVKKYTSLIVKEEQLHHPHTLRHSFASLTVQHTDINTVKELMNHKNINTTMLYIQSNDKLKRKAITDSYANIF